MQLNTYDTLVCPVVYLNTTDPLPENHDCVFILKEENATEQKLENLSDAMGCILIENSTKNYTFNNSSQYHYPIAKLDGTASNISIVLSEIMNGSVYGVDNLQDNVTLVFQNYSDFTCCQSDCVYIFQLGSEGDYARLLGYAHLWRLMGVDGIIMSSHQPDTHIMTHAVRDWSWFQEDYIFTNLGILNKGIYTNRYALPIFSVDGALGNSLFENKSNWTATGWLNQTYRQQTTTTPGVNSHNVVAYRNISNSPDFPITVLSNRMDSWWAEAAGDSGIGGAILLGIAKYFNDYNITPKYNLHFLFTTGEEYGMRGAQHYVDSHPKGTGQDEYNFKYFIGFDQLGFNYTIDPNKTYVLHPHTNNNSIKNILQEIATQTNYEERTVYHFECTPEATTGAEDYIWNQTGVDTILLEKGGGWDGHHQVGDNFSKGDSLNYIDRNDVNVTFELAWNVTKYITVWPNCWFDNITYEAINTSGGTAPDTLKTTYTVKSVLPNDRVMIHARFYNTTGAEKVHQFINITTNRTGVTHTITFSLPPGDNEGDYNVTIEVYNSTARINRQLDLPSNCSNDTGLSQKFHLNRCHTLGDIRIGTSAIPVYDNITGSQFTPTEYAKVHNITAYLYGTNYPSSPTYQCMIYRYSDGHLIANTSLVMRNQIGWYTFTFTLEPALLKNTSYVLAIWGNNNKAKIYSTYQLSANAYHNGSYTFGSPPPENITWDEPLTSQRSIFCQYTPDTTPAEITDVAHTPDTLGYGFNVTIIADVTDDVSGVNQVTVQITNPNGFSIGNNTMTHLGGDTYQHVSTNQWVLGQYNYTIWAIDNASNVNSSSGHHFHVSVNASISIATLQDSYTGDEYINITDPPNPSEDYTLVCRGLTWDEYYNDVTGQNILKVSTMPINYQDDNDTWTPINTTLNQLPSNHPAYAIGYRKGNDHGLYGLYFKSNAQQEWPIAFTYNRSDDPTTYAVRSKLIGVGYVDPANNWSYEYLQSVQSSQGQINDNSITYEDVFTGTDVTWSYSNTGLKEEITLSNATKTVLQNHPPSQYGLNNASSYLVFITKLDYQNLNLYNTSGLLDDNVSISDKGVDFKDTLGQIICSLPLGEAYEQNNESVQQKLTYRIIHLNGNTYLLSGLRLTDLSAMTFPVVIDPTIKVYPTTDDGHISNSSTNYNTAWTTTTGAISSTSTTLSIGQQPPGIFPTYYVYRGYLFFDTTTLPSNAYIDNATLGLYKSNDYSTTDFLITVQNGQPTYPHDPLQTGDYGKNQYSGNGGVVNTSSLVNGYNNITLNSDGKNWLNRTGLTKLCLRSNRDINGNTPTNNEYVKIYTSEQGTGYEPLLTITYRNQSKIKNTGSTTFKGYLLIQVQYNDSGTWVVDDDTVNETSPRTITILDQLALDQIFNGMVKASDLRHGNGTYRVYTAFRDPNGTILKTETVSGGGIGSAELKAWWLFTKT